MTIYIILTSIVDEKEIFNSVVAGVLVAIVGGVGIWLGRGIRQGVKELRELREVYLKVNIHEERLGEQGEKLENHEKRIERLEIPFGYGNYQDFRAPIV